MRFDEVLRTFAAFFERAQIRYAVAGGLAIHAWGRSRSTYDIDFVVDGSMQKRTRDYFDRAGLLRIYDVLGRES